MSENKITLSYINGNPGLVIKGDTAKEVEELFRSMVNPTTNPDGTKNPALFKRFKAAVDTYKEKQANDAAKPPGQTTETCSVHGTEKIWKTGTSKAGKVYAFWACPTKNADGSFCKAGSK